MSQLVQKWHNVSGQEDNWASSIDGNLLEANEITSKISISAPPGTIIQLVSTTQPDIPKRILVGPNGIFDFSYEGIDIKEISFPIKTGGENPLKAYLNIAIEQLEDAFATFSDPLTDSNYTNFCSVLRDLLTGITPEEQETRTLQDVVLSWLDDSQKMQGNDESQLNNVIVNYILAN